MERRFLVATGAATIAYALVPPGDMSRVLALALSGVCLAAFWVGYVRHRPQRGRSVWRLLGTGLAVMTAGDVGVHVLGEPLAAEAVYGAGYALCFASAIVALRLRGSGQDRSGLVDAAILTTTAAVVLWPFVVEPTLAATTGTAARVQAVLFPLLDVLLFGLIARLLLAPGAHVRSLSYLIGSLAVALTGDVAAAAFALDSTSGWVEASSLLARAFAAAAALTPSMRALTQRGRPAGAHLQPFRLVVMGTCFLLVALLVSVHELAANGLTAGLGVVAGLPLLALLVLHRLVRVVRDHEEARRELVHHALHDPLTGLANAALLTDRLAHRLSRRDPSAATVVMVDLEGFRAVNDDHGYTIGDAVLAAVGERIATCLRPSDTVARLGQDFAVLLDGQREAEEGVAAAERIVAVLADPVVADGHPVRLSIAVGVATGGSGQAAEEVLRNVRVAAQSARGTDARLAVYGSQAHTSSLARIQLRADLDEALVRGQLSVVYQPIVRLADAEVQGAEALLRWTHPEHGPISPATFIPVAEDSGAIVGLGRWVLREACQAAARWPATSVLRSVSVNLSPRQLRDPRLVADVADALKESRLDPRALVLEITEGVLMEDTDRTLVTLHELKRLGVRLAIDDFGTGYSSLAYLERFPIDVIKIDKSFIDTLGQGVERGAVARGILELTQRLGVVTVAEGIEHDLQVLDLVEQRCELGQGYLFARPLPLDALTDLLHRELAASQTATVPS